MNLLEALWEHLGTLVHDVFIFLLTCVFILGCAGLLIFGGVVLHDLYYAATRL